MVKQVKDEYEAKTGLLHRYLAKLKTLLSSFDSFTLEFFPREVNRQVKALAPKQEYISLAQRGQT